MSARRVTKLVYDKARNIWQPALTEEHVVLEIMQRIGFEGISIWRINCPVGGKVRPNVPGIPDLIGYVSAVNGTTGIRQSTIPLYIEVKRPGGARRPAQELFIAKAKADGCCAFFAESWSDCVKEFKAIGIELKTGG